MATKSAAGLASSMVITLAFFRTSSAGIIFHYISGEDKL